MLPFCLCDLVTPMSTTTSPVFCQHFSFEKLADPCVTGPFRMTSSFQSMPTVLSEARMCFSV